MAVGVGASQELGAASPPKELQVARQPGGPVKFLGRQTGMLGSFHGTVARGGRNPETGAKYIEAEAMSNRPSAGPDTRLAHAGFSSTWRMLLWSLLAAIAAVMPPRQLSAQGGPPPPVVTAAKPLAQRIAQWDEYTGGALAAPRLSAAWSPKWSGGARFSAGWGIFYDAITLNMLADTRAPNRRSGSP